MGPIEWAVVMKYLVSSGLFVRLEDSGEKAFMDMVSVDDHLVCGSPDYWPDEGERVRVRGLGVWPGGEVRVRRRLFIDRPVTASPPSGFFACRDNRSHESVVAYTRTLPAAVVGRVREVADVVSARDWGRAAELTSGNRLDWEEVDDFMTTYGWPPFTPLSEGFEKDMYAAPLRGGGNWIGCLLWTEAERPGGVEISFRITPPPPMAPTA